jgi:glycosyltransferase involved in cell wall biosynthesis
MDGFVAFLGRRLPSLGINTTVVHTDTVLPGYRGTGGHLARALRSDGVPIAQLSEVDCRQWLSEHRPEVVSAHGTPDWLIAAATDTGIPVVETLHRTLLERESWARERVRSRQITAFVAVSELARRQYLVANPDYPADRVITIPNGVDDRHISHRDRARSRAWLGLGDEFLFVSLARYCLQKNPFGLLTAFSEVAAAHPQAHLLLAGRADDAVLLEQVRRLRDRLPGGDRIHLRGHCPDAAAVLAAADAFVLDSFFEGWPLASMEALFSGLPVVMSEVGGAREQVGDDGQRGYVVPNPLGDPEAIDWRGMAEARFRPQVNQAALVAAMSAVVDERDRWAAAREGLRAESVARFSAEECLRRHADVLTRAAAGTLPGLLAANTARS